MAQDIKKNKKRTRKIRLDFPLTELAKNIAFPFNIVKDHRDSIKRKKDKASLKKNKDMIMGGIEGFRRPSGRKANSNKFTLGEMQHGSWQAGAKSPVVPLVKVLKQRGKFDPALARWIKDHTTNRFLPYGDLSAML